jgi:hypothetical protein
MAGLRRNSGSNYCGSGSVPAAAQPATVITIQFTKLLIPSAPLVAFRDELLHDVENGG